MAGPSRMDVCYTPGSDEIWKRDQFDYLMMVDPDRGFPQGSDTSPKAPKAMSNEPKAARVTFTLPYRPCDICSMDHVGSRCSYWDCVPQGATVGPGYQVLCRGCGGDFIVAKWVCNFCGGREGQVFHKFCSVCNICGQHNTDECPIDEDTAAMHKFLKERDRQVKALVPVEPSYVPPPRPDFEPVKPSYVPHVPGLSVSLNPQGGRTLDKSDMAGPSRMDVSYPPGSDEIRKRDQIGSLMMADPDRGFPLGSDTYPEAKSNEPKAPKAMSNEPKAARVTFTLPDRPCDICSMDHADSRTCCPWLTRTTNICSWHAAVTVHRFCVSLYGSSPILNPPPAPPFPTTPAPQTTVVGISMTPASSWYPSITAAHGLERGSSTLTFQIQEFSSPILINPRRIDPCYMYKTGWISYVDHVGMNFETIRGRW
ncbi:hypothetical protein M0R45_010707 [Rubus argutus]|uniref:Uncharacterized protein n=1 Tax=Rubus argutus TaxID=59490 RepID=A0AAW1YAE3_RUBAR